MLQNSKYTIVVLIILHILPKLKHSKQLHPLHHTLSAHIWSSPLTCRFHYSSSQRMQHICYLLLPSTHSLHKPLVRNKVSWEAPKGHRFKQFSYDIPGGVPQHMFLSSMCSTSRPMNHAPSDTSSLAYLCNIGLQSQLGSPLKLGLYPWTRIENTFN